MKTLADLKRAMVIGSKWHTFHVLYEVRDLGIREIGFRDTVKVGFKKGDNFSYFDFPTADLVEFHGDEVRVYVPADKYNDTPKRHILTYIEV